MKIIAVDWGKDAAKRSAYLADPTTRSLRRLPGLTTFQKLIDYAQSLSPPVLIGIDAAIGFPLSSWEQVFSNTDNPPRTFMEWLKDKPLPEQFFRSVSTPGSWSPRSPFINPPAKQSWSLNEFIETSQDGLHRSIDRLLGGNSIFVASGIPGSVGSGTRALWQEIVALDNQRKVGFWPFEGSLDALGKYSHSIVGEMYPKACYGIALHDTLPAPLLSIAKTKSQHRAEAMARLLCSPWINKWDVKIANVEAALENEDDFDALMSAAALLRLVLERASLESLEPKLQLIEGGVLGSASLDMTRKRS